MILNGNPTQRMPTHQSQCGCGLLKIQGGKRIQVSVPGHPSCCLLRLTPRCSSRCGTCGLQHPGPLPGWEEREKRREEKPCHATNHSFRPQASGNQHPPELQAVIMTKHFKMVWRVRTKSFGMFGRHPARQVRRERSEARGDTDSLPAINHEGISVVLPESVEVLMCTENIVQVNASVWLL